MKNYKKVPSGLSNLKSKVDKLDMDELVPVPVDLSELSDVAKNEVKNSKIKNSSCQKRLIGILVWECKDEVLNTTETLLNDKKVAYAKSNYFIYTILLEITYLLLLVVICVSCYFYYTKYQPKQKYLLPFQDTSIKLNIKNIL